MFIVRKPGQDVSKEDILGFLAERVAKWWVPDDVIFLEALPVGGTGKVQKADLRKQYGGVFEAAS
jgi:fatty-acyl-CoA synthase